jgi:predicted transcriptional regulator
MSAGDATKTLELTGQIISAFVGKNAVSHRDLPNLITQVYSMLSNLKQEVQAPAIIEKLEPAVSIKKSIGGDYLICLEDGKKFKTLKRHLSKAYNLTPDQYRQKWNLPHDYPMVAPAYSAQRQVLALGHGLGRKSKVIEVAALAPVEAITEKPVRKRLHLPFFGKS